MTPRRLRIATLAFGSVLALLSGWTIVVELSRPYQLAAGPAKVPTACPGRPLEFPTLWRSDVRAGRLTCEAAPLLIGAKAIAERAADFAPLHARAAASLRLSPSETRLWLLMALLELRFTGLGAGFAEHLKMSYYTGPNEAALMPLRLSVVARLPSFADEELVRLVRHELRLMASHKMNLRTAITTAYRGGSEAGQRFIGAALEDIDPALATELRAGATRE